MLKFLSNLTELALFYGNIFCSLPLGTCFVYYALQARTMKGVGVGIPLFYLR